MKNEKGVALILTIMITAILAVIVLEFMQTTKMDLEIVKNYKYELEAYGIARSGIEFAKYALKGDDQEIDSLKEDWAKDYSKILSSVMFKNGNLKLIIVDESSKINVNSVVLNPGSDKEKLDTTKINILKNLCAPITNQDYRFVDALVDWIDKNDDVVYFEGQQEQGGAEDRDYQEMTPPYRCKNAPLDTVRELFLLKGFNNESYFGTKEEEKEEVINKRIGLKDFLTVWGNNLININTASSEVIMSLHLDIDEGMAQNIVKARDENPFTSIDNLKQIGLSDQIANKISKNIMFKSAGFFSVQAIGSVNNIIVEINAVLYRSSQAQISVVYLQEM